ncbi:MAG: T9SS type A sorting domain-containing protein [Saprospiraceae bacterium]
MRKFLGLFIFTLLSTSLAFAGQNVEVTHNKIVSSTTSSSNTSGNSHYVFTCKDGSGFFSDRAGNHKPYDNHSDYYVTLCAQESDKAITVDFQQFKLEKFDNLTIWDESRSVAVTATNTPEILNVNIKDKDDGVDKLGTYTGPASPGKITSKRGCLTFRFRSDRSVVETGWYGKIGCVNKPSVDACASFRKNVDSDLKCGVMIKDDNYRGKNNYSEYGSCTKKGWPSMGRELIYRFRNYKASDLTFTLQEDNGDQPKLLNMFILNDCRPDACVGSVNRPAEHYDKERNSVTLKNAPAGDYYVVIDGNRVTGHNWFKLLVECTGGDYTTCKDSYYYDDFEAEDKDVARPRPADVDYQVGDYITKVNSYWSKSNNVGLRDARISNDRSSNGHNSLEFNRLDEGTQDVFLDLGRKFKGVYRICWNMYIEKNRTAFFGLFGGDNSDPWGSISKEFGMNSPYQGRWFDVELFVDLDKNKFTLYMDNRYKAYSGDYHLNLDALNFYGLPNAHFYVDHLCYGPVKKIPARGSLTRMAILEDTPLYAADKQQLQLAGSIQGITDNGLTRTTVNTLNAADLKVVPNPTRGFTTIALDLDKAQNIELQIFSPTGQVVRQISLGETSIIRQELNLGDLANGLYILKATGETSVITKKIILQQ